MAKIEKVVFTLQQMEMRSESAPALDSRIAIIVTIFYLVVMLSVSLGRLSMLIWMALYPVIASPWLGLSYGRIFRNSLIVLPLVLLIGIFNPIFDRSVAFSVGGVEISRGWISCASIVIRGLLAMQAVLILIATNGFLGICRGLSRLGVPRFLTEQLQFVYRYLIILLEEVITMKQAREARGYGRSKYPLRMWGAMIGQLFLRAIDRSERIARAMEARGFTGRLPEYTSVADRLSSRDLLFLIFWIIAIASMRIWDLSALFIKL